MGDQAPPFPLLRSQTTVWVFGTPCAEQASISHKCGDMIQDSMSFHTGLAEHWLGPDLGIYRARVPRAVLELERWSLGNDKTIGCNRKPGIQASSGTAVDVANRQPHLPGATSTAVPASTAALSTGPAPQPHTQGPSGGPLLGTACVSSHLMVILALAHASCSQNICHWEKSVVPQWAQGSIFPPSARNTSMPKAPGVKDCVRGGVGTGFHLGFLLFFPGPALVPSPKLPGFVQWGQLYPNYTNKDADMQKR